jgi:hypothetical protein
VVCVSPDNGLPASSSHPSAATRRSPAAAGRRALVAFGRFWWDFLVGDTPELLVGAAVAVGLAALVVHTVGARAVVIGTLPLLVIGILTLSTHRARSRARRSGGGP